MVRAAAARARQAAEVRARAARWSPGREVKSWLHAHPGVDLRGLTPTIPLDPDRRALRSEGWATSRVGGGAEVPPPPPRHLPDAAAPRPGVVTARGGAALREAP